MNKRALAFLPLFLLLSACTTERYIEPADAERASELRAQLGLGYLKQGQFQRAKNNLEKAIDLNPDNPHAYHYMGELYRRLKENDEAEKYYLKAISIAPSDMNIQNNYGVFLCDRGDYEKAYKQFQKILNDPLYDARANAHENVGLCALREGKLQKAEESFDLALKINPKLPKSLIQSAQISFDRGNKAQAYDQFKRYVAIAPQTPESLWLGILLESERGNKDTVASYKNLLKGKYPDSDEAKRLKKLEAKGNL